MTYLLFLAGRPDGHGIRPHIIKVETISTLMTEGAKGDANLSQLAIQGNYMAVAAQDADMVYPRNLAQRQIFVTKFAQNHFRTTKTPSLPRMTHRYFWANIY